LFGTATEASELADVAALRDAVGSGFEGGLRLLPSSTRAAVARRLLRVSPRALRLSLAGRAIPALRPDDDLAILSGPLEGWRWLPASGLHACLEGTYEDENQTLFREHVRTGAIVFDIGANVGFFTLLASQLVGPTGRVVAFEPFPAALRHLRRHLALNDVRNVTVVEAAVSASPGTAHFRSHEELTMGRLSESGELAVDVVSLDDLCQRDKIPVPGVIKIDVEGEELNILRGAERILRERRPLILLATHGADVHEACCRLLTEHGYRLEELPYDMVAPEFDFLGEVAAFADYDVAAAGLGLSRRSSATTSGSRHTASGT
jgi:FkbM family methyltransferase